MANGTVHLCSYYLSQKKILEVNPYHPLVQELRRRVTVSWCWGVGVWCGVVLCGWGVRGVVLCGWVGSERCGVVGGWGVRGVVWCCAVLLWVEK